MSNAAVASVYTTWISVPCYISASTSSRVSVCSSIGRCSDNSLQRRLHNIGDSPGPITNGTRALYERRLQILLKQPQDAITLNTTQQELKGIVHLKVRHTCTSLTYDFYYILLCDSWTIYTGSNIFSKFCVYLILCVKICVTIFFSIIKLPSCCCILLQ